jgi:uncharacterized membrane protein YccC
MVAPTTSDPARERLPGRLLDRIAASDPALSRLRLASRAMLSLGLSGAVLAAVTFFQPLPIAAYGITAVVSFTGSMSVRDKSVRAQMVTRAMAAVAATLSVLLASLLAPVPLVADLVFLAVIFLAVYARRYGPRGFSVGMIAFMAYFIGDYLRPAPSDIGWVALAIVLAFAVTHLMTFIVLPDNPERDFRRSVAAIDRRINLVLRELMEPGAASVPSGDTRKTLQAHLARLHDTVLMAEGFIPQGEAGSLAAEGAASDLAIALFELQLAVERLVAASFTALPPADLLLAALRHEDIAASLTTTEPPTPAIATARILLRVQRARSRLEKALDGSPSPAFAAPAVAPTPAVPAAAPDGSQSLIPPVLQVPVQVTLACAIAIGCGLLVSPVRWYWAVITAFIVFNNTRSRADTAVRALQRSAGTFGGLIVGTGVATLVHGQPEVSVVAILVLFFFAFYFVQTSYSLMIFLITVALALLYGLMGMFSPELLVVRLAETLIGGLAGALVAFLVYPTRASTAAADALDKYLAALRDLVAAARGRAHGEAAAGDLFARSRVLDRRYADLALAVRPIGGPWGVVTRFGQVREKLLLLAACTHWARTLARSFAASKGIDEATVARIDIAAGELDAGIAAADARRASFFERREGTPAAAAPRRGIPPDGGEEDPAFALEVISILIARSLADGGRTG